jgi:REP element-mobilizing transposase RayT
MYQKKSIRLKGFDYRLAGYYFVTICTAGRKQLFGECMSDRVLLSAAGKIVQDCWLAIPKLHSHTPLEEFVVMPNHVHGIVNFDESSRAEIGQMRCSSNSLPGSLATIVCAFKSASTRKLRQLSGTSERVWQEGYYEHIIRSETSLRKIRAYIQNNPIRWHLDELNDRRTGGAPLQ